MKILLKYSTLNLLLLFSLTFGLIWITERLILTPEFYERSGSALSGLPGQETAVLGLMQKWIYISAAAYLLVKLGIVTLIIHTAIYLTGHEVSPGDLFRVAVLAEFVFLIPAATKIAAFHYTYPEGTLLDWHRYFILSALSFFEAAPADWYYALQSLNVFEVAYWFVLAAGIAAVTPFDFDRSLRLIMVSYVPALVIWITVVTFSSVLMFPSLA